MPVIVGGVIALEKEVEAMHSSTIRYVEEVRGCL